MASNIRYRTDTAIDASPKVQPDTKKLLGEKLTRNVAIATLLLLTVIGLRESGPQGKALLQTIQDTVESQWDQNVGKLTYVSNTIAESIQVFGRSPSLDTQLLSPVAVQAVQAWTAEAPYLLYENAGNVFAAASGEVVQIAHDDYSEYIVRISHADGLNTLYYGLSSCFVQEGDSVQAETLLGISGSSFAFEAQKNGKSIDCSGLLAFRESAH